MPPLIETVTLLADSDGPCDRRIHLNLDHVKKAEQAGPGRVRLALTTSDYPIIVAGEVGTYTALMAKAKGLPSPQAPKKRKRK